MILQWNNIILKFFEKSVDKVYSIVYYIYCSQQANEKNKCFIDNVERCPSGLRSWSWKPVTPKGAVGSNPTLSAIFIDFSAETLVEKYPSGWRGSPGKGVDR